jgi:hypothetical protein
MMAKGPEQDDLLRARLVEIIDMRHELVKLAFPLIETLKPCLHGSFC